MADSPVRISVELEGIEPNDRFLTALDELAAAADALLAESAEVEGLAVLELPYFRAAGGVWSAKAAGVRSFIYTPEFKK